MGTNLRILLSIFSIIWFVIIFILLKKDKIPVKYSMVWFLSAFILFLVSIFPNFMYKITTILGFQTPSNMIVGVILTLLLFITICLTIIVSNQRKKISYLIQEVSIIKKDENEKK